MDRRQLLLGISLLLGLVMLRVWDPIPVQVLRNAYFDGLQRIAPREYTAAPVRVVDVDEASLSALGQWPWPRDIMTDLVQQLRDYGAAVVVFDMLFAEEDRYSPSNLLRRNALSTLRLPDGVRNSLETVDFDKRFARSFARVPVVLGTARRTGEGETEQPPKADIVDFGVDLLNALPPLGSSTPVVPVLREKAAGVGSVNVNPYADSNIIRTVPLVWGTGQGGMPSLALEALRVALGEDAIILWGDEAAPGVVQAVGVGQIDIPTLPDAQIWVHFRRDVPELYLSAKDILEPELDPALQAKLDGHIVFVGTSAAGLFDIRTTALGESVPGVSIQAQIVEQILLGEFLQRADWVEGAEILALVLMGLIVGYRMVQSGPVWSFLTGFLSAVVMATASWLAYSQYSILFDATFPLIGGFVAFAIVAGYQFVIVDIDKRQIRRSFARYVAPAVLEQIEAHNYELELGGVNTPATVMFCDIRNFTTLSESYEADRLVSLLNELFDHLSAEILATEGTIDKFIGDSVMAFWNAPVKVPDHAERACRAALGMRRAVRAFNKDHRDRPIRVAVGISTGEVCVGNIGSRDRFDYSVIGDTVNVAARVEAACRHVAYDITISQDVIDDGNSLACLYAGELALKGVTRGTRAYIVAGDEKVARSAAFRELSQTFDRWIDALASGADKTLRESILDQCRTLGSTIDPHLVDFFDRASERAEDFAPSVPLRIEA